MRPPRHVEGPKGMAADMRILICDDDKAFAEHLKALLLEQLVPVDRWVKVDCVSDPLRLSGEDLARYDIAFLDIDMGETNGIDLARRLRTARQDTILLFVTNFVEYSLVGYEVQAFRYLLKNELDQKLNGYVQEALAVLQKRRERVRLNCEGEEVDFLPQDLIYVETEQRHLLLHLQNTSRDILRTRCTMAELEGLLEEHGFLRIHKSYLVNMAYIKKLQSTVVLLTNNTELPVSSHSYAALKKAYLRWKGQRRWTLG